MKYVVINGQFASGPSTYCLAKSFLPFSFSPHQPAGVTDCHLDNARPVNVLYYAVHRFIPHPSSDPVLTVMARVLWLQIHPNRHCMGKPVEVWCPNLFESSSDNNFLPVENMKSQLITSETTVSGELVPVVIPVV